MTVLTSPRCPDCRQPYTGVYFKHFGCNRCERIGASVKPTPVLSPVLAANPT